MFLRGQEAIGLVLFLAEDLRRATPGGPSALLVSPTMLLVSRF